MVPVHIGSTPKVVINLGTLDSARFPAGKASILVDFYWLLSHMLLRPGCSAASC